MRKSGGKINIPEILGKAERDAMNAQEYKALLGIEKKQSKYRAKSVVYNGNKYASTKEADYALGLDFCLKEAHPSIVKWERQLSYSLGINGTHITKYILDFKVWHTDGTVSHIDVKGYKKGQAYAMFKVKKALMQAILGIEVIER